jgi:Ca2+:H+ antiporter
VATPPVPVTPRVEPSAPATGGGGGHGHGGGSGVGGFAFEPLDLLLLAIPVAIALKIAGVGGVWLFAVSCLAVIPLAGLMGRATEALSERMGPGIGGLLNATFGNAAELIIALIALSKGPQNYELVKASITGSIIGNILLVLGAATVAGGLFHKRQTFNPQAAGMGSTLLTLAAIGLLVPSILFYIHGQPTPEQAATAKLELISEEIAVVLAVTYGLSLLFSLGTHSHLYAGDEAEAEAAEEADHAMGVGAAVGLLLAATVGVGVMSEFLVGSVEEAAHAIGMNQVFVGVIVVAVIGNAAEHSTAVLVAMKNKMDLAMNIAIGSSIQIALFVAPVLVFASVLMGHPHPLDLHFSAMEVFAVAASVIVLMTVSQDGETHWMEGVMLLAVYVILGFAFFHLPGGPHAAPHGAAH